MGMKNRVEATAKNIEGKILEVSGDLAGDTKAKHEGQKKQAEAKVQHAVEDVKEVVKKKID